MRDIDLSRRHFLRLGAAAGLAAAAPGAPATTPHDNLRGTSKKVGIALGGGGARGLAHIVLLQALDEMGVRPAHIAGTSMGAVIGALYASGLSGRDIAAIVASAAPARAKSAESELSFIKRDIYKWIDLIDPAIGTGGLLDTHGLIKFLNDNIKVATFEQLKTPLKIIAGDLWRHEQAVLDAGDLKSAVEASIAFPGLFAPQHRDDRILVDGGTVNPVPYDVLQPHCDVVIAVDVSGRRTLPSDKEPSFFESIFNSFQTMERMILEEKLRRAPPDIYIKPDLVDIRLLDFAKAEQVYQQTQGAKRELQQRLQQLLA